MDDTDDNRQRLLLKDYTLSKHVAEVGECTQVEFRRRCDLLYATHTSLTSIWAAVDEKTAAVKLASKVRRTYIEYGVFLLGAIINWLFAPEGKSYVGFGATLMIGAAFSHIGGVV